MLLRYRDLESFAYAISEKTSLSQPQAELYIDVGLIRGYSRENGAYLISDEKIRGMDTGRLLQHKPYTAETLARELGTEPVNINRIISHGIIKTPYQSGNIYLFTDVEVKKMKTDLPGLLSQAYDAEQLEEEELEKELGEMPEELDEMPQKPEPNPEPEPEMKSEPELGPELPDDITDQEKESKKRKGKQRIQASSPAMIHYEETVDFTEQQHPEPENPYRQETYGAASYRSYDTFEKTDTLEETRYDNRPTQQGQSDPAADDAGESFSGDADRSRYSPYNNPQHVYAGNATSEYDPEQFRQDSDTIKVENNNHTPDSPGASETDTLEETRYDNRPTQQGQSDPAADDAGESFSGDADRSRYSPYNNPQHVYAGNATSEYDPEQFRQDSDTIKVENNNHTPDSPRASEKMDTGRNTDTTTYQPTSGRDGGNGVSRTNVPASIPYAEKTTNNETKNEKIRTVRKDSDTIQSEEYGKVKDKTPQGDVASSSAEKTKKTAGPQSVTGSTTEGTSVGNKQKPFYDNDCGTSSREYHSHIISYATEQPVLKYQDIPVAYVSRNEEFKETWMQGEAKPVAAETHDPIQMSNLYYMLSESPEQIKPGQYALHLTNGEKIAVTRETVRSIAKSENLPEADGGLVSLEKTAYVDRKGSRTCVFGISGMEEFTATSIGRKDVRTQENQANSGHTPSKGKTTVAGETTQAATKSEKDRAPVSSGTESKKRQIHKKDARMAVLGRESGGKVSAEYQSAPQNHAGQEDADVFRIKKTKTMDKSAFAEIGAMAFGQSFGGTNAYAGYRTVNRYAGWIDPVTNRIIKKAELKATEKVFCVNNKLGNIDHSLRNAGVKTDVLKNKKGKYKKKLSDQEIKYLMHELNTKFKAANLGNVDLIHMDDKKIKELIKKLSGKDKEIVKCYAELRNIAGLRKGKANLTKRSRRKLLSLFNNIMNGTDFYDGMMLTSHYARLTCRMITYGGRIKRWAQRKVGKVVKPYGRHLDKRAARKELKVNARVERKLQKKMSRQTRRQARRARNIDRVSRRLTGKSAAQLKNSFQSTKVGRGISKIRGKLSPVMKIQKRTVGVVSKVVGKTFNIIGKVFSAPRRLAMWALALIAPVFLICVLVTIGAAAILAAFDIIPESDSVMAGGETVVVNAANECVEKDNSWYREIRGIEEDTTPKEANGGHPVMGGYDPLTGTQYEITEFSGETVYKYYDGRAFSYIAEKDGETMDKDALSMIPQINLYSNAKAIMAAAAVYRQEIDIDDQGYVDFCKQLWDHSHAYQSSIGDVYMCSGCKNANIACYKKAEYNTYTNADGENYNFLPGISDTAAADGCYTYYCNDESSYGTAVHKKESVDATYNNDNKGCETTKYDTQYTIYCDFSRHTSDNPGIGDCTGVSGSMKNAYHAHGFYRDVETEGCGAHGADYNDCKFAKNFHKGDGITSTSLSDICASYQIVLQKNGSTKQEVTYNGHSYWIGYCSNLGDLGAEENYDGYILVSKSNANLSADGNYVMNPYLSGGKPVWFYECQGHKMKKRVFSWCPGHAGCRGHNVKYCLGHCTLEVYAAIAGLNDDEIKKEEAKYNLLQADNFFFDEGSGTYDSEWGGYEDEHCSRAAMILDNDWEDLYDLPEDTFTIDTDLHENTW